MNQALTERDAIRKLKEAGFEQDFRVAGERVVSTDGGEAHPPEDLRILEVLRVEGASDVDDGAAIYGLETVTGEKGILVVPFGPQMSPGIGEVVRRLRRRV